MNQLIHIQQSVEHRVEDILASRRDWPCRKGCDDCCRSLASLPRISQSEWARMAAALEALPPATAAELRRRIRASSAAQRPVACPLLDEAVGSCRVYEARPIACRAYGFYAERDRVLGCGRIEIIAAESADVIWGNHPALEADLDALGPTADLARWADGLMG